MRRRLLAMSSFETDDHLPPDHPRRLVMIAYARMSALPPEPNGVRSATIAAYGDHIVRLVELTTQDEGSLPPLWVELYDASIGHMLDGAGCADIGAAVAPAVAFLAEAKSLNAEPRVCAKVEGPPSRGPS
jgi:hypothetical protein